MASSTDFLPSRDGDLRQWARHFSELLSATPVLFGVSVAQAADFATLSSAYTSAYNAATDPGTNSHANIVTKNDAKEAMVNGPGGIRELARQIRGTAGVTNPQKAQLGLTVRKVQLSPIVQPAVAPTLTIVATVGRRLKMRLRDAENPDRRGKPNGVDGATVLTYVGVEPPADPAEWSFAFNTSRTLFDVDFPATLAVGAQVWVTAFWFNPRKQVGPPATPQTTHIGAGLAMAA